jgi:hypothetical protein
MKASMKTYCIDVSGSMTNGQIKLALSKVAAMMNNGDHVILFDNCQALQLDMDQREIENLIEGDSNLLRMMVFKLWAGQPVRPIGAYKASTMAFYYSEKICLTDGCLPKIDLEKFDEVIQIDPVECDDYEATISHR